MIEKVLERKDKAEKKKDVYNELKGLYTHLNGPYPDKQAAGSIGGAKTHGYIKDNGSDYVCQRNPR